MKILLVGQWRWTQYEEAFANGLRVNGAEVISFSTSQYFCGVLGRIKSAIPLLRSPLLDLNNALVVAVNQHRPDWVLFWRPTSILPGAIQQIVEMGIRTVSYNNDDPFSPIHRSSARWRQYTLWYWYLRCLPHFDRNFFFRRVNCVEAQAFGARHAAVLLPYFVPEQDRPMTLTADDHRRFDCDVVFVGHFESDGRDKVIRAMVDAGIDLKLWGGATWDRSDLSDICLRLGPVKAVIGDDYRRALCGAEICLCLLSRLNRDSYTTRCFEIPACRRVMLAERTQDLLTMFKEDEEACFFSSIDELIQKIKWLLADPLLRSRIAEAGFRRVWSDGHMVESRSREVLSTMELFDSQESGLEGVV